MPSQDYQIDRAKLKEAVLLIASYCPPEELGNVKLHKILYFSDMLHFLDEGRPLTGADYVKQKFGPVARQLTSVINELSSGGLLRVSEENYFGVFKKTYITKHEYSRDRLSEPEVVLIKEVSDFVRGKTAKEISEISHNGAWDAVDLGDTIPYFTALRLIPAEVDDSDRRWATEVAREYAVEPFPAEEILH